MKSGFQFGGKGRGYGNGGSFGGKGWGNQQMQCPPQASGLNALSGLTQQLGECVSAAQGLAQFAQLGAVLNQQQQQPQASSSDSAQATELAGALCSVLSRGRGSGGPDSRLTASVKRLSNLAGLEDDPADLDVRISELPSFKKLRQQMEGVNGELAGQRAELAAQRSELSSIKSAVVDTASGMQEMKAMMAECLRGREAPRGGPPPRGPGPGVLGIQPQDPPAATAVRVPMLQKHVSQDIHDNMLPVLGIGTTRRDMVELRATMDEGNITFEAWWAAVGKCKGIALWKGKIETLSGGSHAVNGLTIETVGQAVFRHVDSDGEWSPVPLQPSP